MTEATDSPTLRRIYGTPGAEVLYDDPATVYEMDIEPWVDEHDRRPRQIEEWSVHPPDYHLPDTTTILEWISEWVADNGEVTEGVYDDWTEACASHRSDLAAKALRQVIASQVTKRMACKLVATHEVTWDDESEPLYDGQPLHRQRGGHR